MGYSMTIWYILCSFGTFFTKKNLATLRRSQPVLKSKSPHFFLLNNSGNAFVITCFKEGQVEKKTS
jgi:hypothetical protein